MKFCDFSRKIFRNLKKSVVQGFENSILRARSNFLGQNVNKLKKKLDFEGKFCFVRFGRFVKVVFYAFPKIFWEVVEIVDQFSRSLRKKNRQGCQKGIIRV